MEKKKIILKDRPSYPLTLKGSPSYHLRKGLRKGLIIRFLGLLFLFSLIFLPGYSKFQELSQKNKLLVEKIRQIELSNKRLENEIKRLEEDPAYVEKIARDKLRVTKKGELIIESKP